MNELEIKKVPFLNTELMAARDNDGQIWAGVRWMCDGIGLSRNQRDNQIEKIKADKVLFKGAGNFPLPTKGGVQEVLCLKLDYVPLWLAKISITPAMARETPELADRLEQYQLRAKDVLAAAFMPDIYTAPMETATGVQRALTPDDYLRAASIVANCRNERLPYVLDFLDQGGFSVREVEKEIVNRAEKATPTDRLLVDLLNRAFHECGFSDSKMADLTGIGRMQIWRYRKGVNSPRDIRRTEYIIQIIADAINQPNN